LPLFSSRQAGEFVLFAAFRQDVFLTFFSFSISLEGRFLRTESPVFRPIQLGTSLEADGDSSPGTLLMSTPGPKNVALL
jgi:hypothetical protein